VALALHGVNVMSKLWTCMVCWIALTGCSSDGDCPAPRAVTSSEGGLQGVLFENTFGGKVAMQPNGDAMCVTCSGLVDIAPDLHQLQHIDASGGSDVVVGADGAMYLVVGDTDPAQATLMAYAAGGAPRWSATLPTGSSVKVVAAAEGPYAQTTLQSPERITMSAIEGFDPTTGAMRSLASETLLGAAPGGGVLTGAPDARGNVLTLHRLDATGAPAWTVNLTPTTALVSLLFAVAAPDGSSVFVGTSGDVLTAGTVTIPMGDVFVLVVDRNGQPTSGFSMYQLFVDAVAVSPQGDILLAGDVPNPEGQQDTDAMLAVASPTGVVRTISVTGKLVQQITSLAPAADGTVWMQVENEPVEGTSAPMMVGDQTFAAAGTYLFDFAY
jgi:hypothetical protein